jgi:hypothetical protein
MVVMGWTSTGPGGSTVNPLVTEPGGSTAVAPFGEAQVTQMEQVAALKCPNNVLNAKTFAAHESGSGSTTADAGEILVQTGTTTGSRAYAHSKRFISYLTGQGAEARFTGLWPDGVVAGHEAWVGVGDYEEALLLGHNGTSFGFMRWYGGQVEIRELAVSAAPTSSGDVTVTVNGGAVVVAVLDTDTIGDAVRKVAAASYAAAGGGWDTHGDGSVVEYHALGTEARAGTYSFVDTDTTGMAASFSTVATAVAPTEVFTALADWTHDQADGTKQLPAYDLTKGLPFKLAWQWLGYGPIFVYMENAESGKFVLAHLDKVGNRQAVPSLANPDLPLAMFADNGATSTNARVRSAAMAGFITGSSTIPSDVRHGSTAAATISTTELPIQAIRLSHHFNGQTSKIRAVIDSFGFASDAAKPSTFRVYRGVSSDFGLTGAPTWTAIDAGAQTSVMLESSDATGWADGDLLLQFGVPATGSTNEALDSQREILLAPGNIILITGQVNSGGASSTLRSSIGWREAW